MKIDPLLLIFDSVYSGTPVHVAYAVVSVSNDVLIWTEIHAAGPRHGLGFGNN